MKYVCELCGELCDVEEESFDYAGTHCNNGQAGRHYTGVLISCCCGENVKIYEDEDEV